MKILPEIQGPSVERLPRPSEPTIAFEDALDMATLRSLRQKQDRAFSFAQRGVLALSENAGGQPVPPACAPPEPLSVELIGAEAVGPRWTRPAGSVVEIPTAGPAVHLAATLPSAETAPPPRLAKDPPPAEARWAAAPDRSGCPATDDQLPSDAMAADRPEPPSRTPALTGDARLTVLWTLDGLVVFASAPIKSPEEIDRLRACAEDVAREHGGPLAQFHLNGALIAPQALSRRL